MGANEKSDRTDNSRTTIERESERELVVTRTFNAPARIVFEAWTKPDLFKQWWVPKSSGMTMLSCEMDIRTGGTYRLVFAHPAFEEPMAFFGRYIEVTTVTFEERDGKTLVVLRDLYASKEALDEAIESGSTSGFGEQFEQLEALLGA